MNHAVESNTATSETQVLSKEMNTHIEEMQLQNAASAVELSMHSASPITTTSNNRRKPSACDICGKVFSRYDNLERHRRTHQGEKLYNCDVCSKSFAQSSYLKVHYRTHSGERPFKCNICGYAFSRSDHLVRHVRTHHLSRQVSDAKSLSGNNLETVQSTSLPTGASQKPQLQQQQVISSQPCPTSNNDANHPHQPAEPCGHHSHLHLHSHLQPNYASCGKLVNNHDCDTTKNASHDKDLKCASGCAGDGSNACQTAPIQQPPMHHLSPNHPGTGLFNCDVCWKAFSQTSHGNIHKRIHATVLPYQCQMCGKSFSRRDNLKRHISTHDGLKSFSCEVCSKAFSRRAYLKVHHRIHTGERPYKCTICDYAFTRNDHLIRHNRPNKGERKFSCIPSNVREGNGCADDEPQHEEQHLTTVGTTSSFHTSNQNSSLVLTAALSSDVIPASAHHMVHTSSSSSFLSSVPHHGHHHHHHHHHHHPHHAPTCTPVSNIFPNPQMTPVNSQVFPSVQITMPQNYSHSTVAPHSTSHKIRHPSSSSN